MVKTVIGGFKFSSNFILIGLLVCSDHTNISASCKKWRTSLKLWQIDHDNDLPGHCQNCVGISLWSPVISENSWKKLQRPQKLSNSLLLTLRWPQNNIYIKKQKFYQSKNIAWWNQNNTYWPDINLTIQHTQIFTDHCQQW